MVKVSIIMAVYNGEKYIGEAITSVISQTYPDWELVIVNDGSTDHTVDIIQSFPDPRIRLFHQANTGCASARNRVLEEAQGEYLAYLDADDVFLPDHLEILTGYLEDHPEVDVVFSDGYYCQENLAIIARISEHRPKHLPLKTLEAIILSYFFSASLCTLVRFSLLKRIIFVSTLPWP